MRILHEEHTDGRSIFEAEIRVGLLSRHVLFAEKLAEIHKHFGFAKISQGCCLVVDRILADFSRHDRSVAINILYCDIEGCLAELCKNAHDASVDRAMTTRQWPKEKTTILRIMACVNATKRRLMISLQDTGAGVMAVSTKEKQLSRRLYYGGRGMGEIICGNEAWAKLRRVTDEHGSTSILRFEF